MNFFKIEKIEKLIFFAILLFLIFVFYPLETFSEGVDFLLGGYFLGTPHPPSYPVYTQLVCLTKYIPLGNLALRANLLTASLSFLFLLFFYKKLKGSLLDRFVCIIVVLFSYTFFINSINGELYVLNLLLIFLIFFLLEKEDKRYLYLNAFILGIGLGVHHTIVFMILYMGYKYFFEGKKISFLDINICIFFIILGASVYLYLPFRAFRESAWNGGNPVNLTLFLNSFFRHDFQSTGFLRDLYTLLQQIVSFNPIREFGLINGFVILVSLFLSFFYDKKFFIKNFVFILLFFIGVLMVVGDDALSYEERLKTYSVFFMPAYIMFVYMFNDFFSKIKLNNKLIINILLTAGIVFNFYTSLINEISYEKAVFPHDYARMNLAMLPRKNVAFLIMGGEKDFPIIYEQKILSSEMMY